MSQTILELQEANYGYSGSFHLKAVSLRIKRASFLGIIGPNGSGKSTLLKGLTGEINLAPHQVFLDGVDMASMSLKARAQSIAVVSQFIEAPDMRVEEYVLLGRTPYRKTFNFFDSDADHAIVEKYMKLTGVAHLRTKKMNQLSGGEMQLVSIAKALTQEPALLLLDEPTSYLDISHQVEVLDLVQELCHNLHLTSLLVIHDLNLAGEYCDELYMMQKGKIFAHGTPCEVLTYENIEKVYNTVVITQENPLSKKPSIFLISKKFLQKKQSYSE